MFIVVSLILLVPGPAWASTASQPATASPPLAIRPLTLFDPSFEYLDAGSGNITYSGDGYVHIWGETFATQYVDSIGVQLTLQRWTGSKWVDVNTGAWTTLSNDYYAYYSNNIKVTKGYYYRVKSSHQVSHNDVIEQGIRYSSSVLAD